MSEDEQNKQHEEMSPLLRLMTRVEGRLDMNMRHADRHPDPNVRADAAVRVDVYKLVMSELRKTLVEVGCQQVDRVVASRRARAEAKVV